MKKILIPLLLALVLGCVVGAGCISTQPDVGGEEPTLKVGDVYTITAEGNPTTGYVWNVTESEGLTIVSETYTQNAANPGMVGVGGVYMWEVTAEEPGTYTFTAEYKRPWETEVAETMTVTVTFT